jgi:hypothetical protein
MNSRIHTEKAIRVVASGNPAYLFLTALFLVTMAYGAVAQRFSAWSKPLNLGSGINTSVFDGCPSTTKDGLNLLFMSAIGSGTLDMFISERISKSDPWETPVSLGPLLNTAQFNEGCPMLTISGRYLFFMSDRPGGCGNYDIYVSRRLNKGSWLEWSEPENLGCLVNSSGPEFSPSIFEGEDGTVELYFSSGLRPGGMGFGDIWVSRLQPNGDFGPAQPVVELNSTANDLRPKIRARDGLEIFFDSNRPGSVLQDIFSARRKCASLDCPWSVPVSLGAEINSSAIDGGAAPSFDGTELYFMSNRAGGFGDQDIWVTRRERLMGP